MIRSTDTQARNRSKGLIRMLHPSMWIILITLSLLLSGLVVAQGFYTELLLPLDGDTGREVTSIVFTWMPFHGVETEEYTLQLSKNRDMSNPILEAKIPGNTTAYTYKGTPLEHNTIYHWRVKISKPLGDWSDVSTFTTKAMASSTDNASTTTPPKDSTKGSFVAALEKIGWPVVGGIAGVILIIVVAVLVLTKPKAPPSSSGQRWTQPFPGMQQPLICSTCGYANTPGRKFCSNCGANLMNRGPQAGWGQPPQQTNSCPTCGFPKNPPGQKFCNNCGASLSIGGQQQPPTGAQQTNLCPSCGMINPPTQRFCSGCGTNLAGVAQKPYRVYQTFSCPVCGAQINKGSNPCPNCRTWLDWTLY